MSKNKILKEIEHNLECLMKENPRDLKLMLDYYIDTYYEDSISALILKWNQAGYEAFSDLFPITTGLVAGLKSINDWVERGQEIQANLLGLAGPALLEIQEYSSKLQK